MPYRPLVCKIRCHNPNRSGSAIANRNNIQYMATSESTDLEKIETSDDEYLEYISRRPRSQGLFGNVDVSDPDALYKEVYDLTRQGKIYTGSSFHCIRLMPIYWAIQVRVSGLLM